MAATPIFLWEGVDRGGREVRGEIGSKSVRTARAILSRRGIRNARITRKSRRLQLGKGRITSGDIALITRQLATLTRAQVPLLQAIEVMMKSSRKLKLNQVLEDIRDQVERGNSFVAALRRHPAQFDLLYCSLVQAGEQSGSLEAILDRLASYQEKTEALRSKIRSAMRYPLFILLMAGLVSTLLLVQVVPQFEDIFAGFGAELPPLTQKVVGLSQFMQDWWLPLALSLCLAWVGYRAGLSRSQRLRDLQDLLVLKLPILGGIAAGSAVSRFARTLSTTIASGLPLLEALESVAATSGNQVYLRAVTNIGNRVSDGTQLHLAMGQTQVFPDLMVQLVAIGEESGTLNEMLDRVADYYEERVDSEVDSLTSLIEPVTMTVLGVIIGGLIVAMYLPVFTLGSVIGGTGHP